MLTSDDSNLPASWYYACPVSSLSDGPTRILVETHPLAAYRSKSGKVVILDDRCSHMGASLARGSVVGDCLRCPFHDWEYGPDGRCTHIPATTVIPTMARQLSYPTAVIGGHVFFFNRHEAQFDPPFFTGCAPSDLLAARPFDFEVDMPWYMVGANGFDVQHFRAAHDRTLIGEPAVDQPSTFARRIACTFEVAGTGVRDQLTRMFSGPRVKMTVTSYRGTMILVTAEFRRTTSYGMVSVIPIDALRCRVRTIVWVRRSGTLAGRILFDPIDAWVRRSFIRAFVRSDYQRSYGIRYNPKTLIDADAVLSDYLKWVVNTPYT